MPTLIGTPFDDRIFGSPQSDRIEGRDGNDIIIGHLGDDHLVGGTGNDIFWGGPGADRILGGDGIDIVAYKTSPLGIVLRPGLPGEGGDAEGDSFTSIEGFVGSAYDDMIVGNTADNILRGGVGADQLNGGWGRDRASYAYSEVAVDVDLTRAVQSGGDAEGDRLVSIEKLTGSDHADRLVGDATSNEFTGGGGADYIDGGDGSDWVDYRGSGAVDIDLARETQQGGHAQGDRLLSVENVRGSTAGDHILGTTGKNHLIGDAGDDYIDGMGGSDRLIGGSGNDTIGLNGVGWADGSEGYDTLVLNFQDWAPGTGALYQIAENGDINPYMPPPSGPVYPPIFTALGFERLIVTGTDHFDDLHGLDGADTLRGEGGNDRIIGSYGDSLHGGDGNDTVQLRYDADDPQAITIDLQAGIATGIAAMTDFENLDVLGGSGDHHITGGLGGTYINTRGGDDFVQILGSSSYVRLSNGQTDDFDIFHGGAGGDTVFMGYQGFADGGGGSQDTLSTRLYQTGDVAFDILTGSTGTGLTFVNFEHFEIDRGDVVGNDIIHMADGNDHVRAAGGRDWIDGRGGDDRLFGGNGTDTLMGGDGNDLLHGEAGNDSLTGEGGSDQFQFSRGDDYVYDFSALEGDMILVPKAYQPPNGITFDGFMAMAEDTPGGLLLHSSFADSTMFLGGIDKADLAEANVVFLTF